MSAASRHTWRAALLAAALTAGGCASTLEFSNRLMFDLNDGIDAGVFRPTAAIYTEFVPGFLRRAVSRVFDNLGEIDTLVNDFLQGKGRQGGADTARFVINSTLGAAGIFDVATGMGFEQHDEDFGQTLGVWGAGPGPYLVLPLFGPSTLRDAPGIAFTIAANPLTWVSERELIGVTRVLTAIDRRARASGDIERRDESAADRYVFTREAFLQRRNFMIHDGNPPDEESEQELENLLEEVEGP